MSRLSWYVVGLFIAVTLFSLILQVIFGLPAVQTILTFILIGIIILVFQLENLREEMREEIRETENFEKLTDKQE